LWKDVIERLNNVVVPTLEEHITSIGTGTATAVASGTAGGSGGIVYGHDRNAGGMSHSAFIANAVEQLRQLERQTQLSFLRFREDFGEKNK
jgi:hypothetical protein